MFIVTDQQLQAFGLALFGDKIKNLLATFESGLSEQAGLEIEKHLSDLVEQAAGYGLMSEKQVAVFVFASWLLGLGFEQKFQPVRQTLLDEGLSADEKARWLKNWVTMICTVIER